MGYTQDFSQEQINELFDIFTKTEFCKKLSSEDRYLAYNIIDNRSQFITNCCDTIIWVKDSECGWANEELVSSINCQCGENQWYFNQGYCASENDVCSYINMFVREHESIV